jgi:hypothetical protein
MNTPNTPLDPSTLSTPFGLWTHDAHGLPCFDLQVDDARHPYAPFVHQISTGRLWGSADRWGNLALATTDGGRGYTDLSANRHQCSGALYPVVMLEGERISLVAGTLAERAVRYGVGYVTWSGVADLAGRRVRMTQTVAAPPGGGQALVCRITLDLLSGPDLPLWCGACSDSSLRDVYHQGLLTDVIGGDGWVAVPLPHPGLQRQFIVGSSGLRGGPASSVGIQLGKDEMLTLGTACEWKLAVGYGDDLALEAARAAADSGPEAAACAWERFLAPARFPAPQPWMEDECAWTLGQFHAFNAYDAFLGEHYISLGGYGKGGFNIREVGEDVLILSQWWPEQAAGNLRWLAKAQHSCGDLPNALGCTPFSEAELQAPTQPGSSDTEIWFLLAVAALGRAAPDLLSQPVAYRDGPTASLWEHGLAAFRWVRDAVACGAHGLVRNCQGDWNDYLFPMGRDGRGESIMNTGMAARAGVELAALARLRRQPALADEMDAFAARLRAAGADAFDTAWFVRGYTDAGKPVGAHAHARLFLDGNAWAALGGLGSRQQRLSALRSAADLCRDPRGLSLLSRPYPCPPPPDISSLPIPPGEGENGGVWPQVTAWALWAMAEHGLRDEALAIWERGALRTMSPRFPETPFGIFNAPDCYNSHLAGPRAHWTQVQMWDRRIYTPMNPAVAWQAFGLQRILSDIGQASQVFQC